MLRTMLLSKIHRAVITQTDLNYVGSITIDKDLLDKTGIKPNEKVEIFDCDNGNRFETYVIEGKSGSGIIGINGAAARLVHKGDRVIVVNYGYMPLEEAENHNPVVITVDNENKVKEVY
ncbi:MAG: aspartate 1-decarboxylase [Candidatus Cloacimonadota bacterium]|nr:MAG: aspartate 1-decarboxylase [Candidatus Cloacimonadota bacterium]